MLEDWRHGGFGLYIHWPFCQAKCPYCDFNSHVSREIDQRRWQTAYLSEIARVGAETEGRVLQSVFFGGGTPSMMDPTLVDSILTKVRSTWPFANDIEVTLEANPTSVEAGRFAGYRDAGVNRVSLGVQALNDRDLKALGRLHSVKEAWASFDIARSVFDRVSFDLIYARQDQDLTAWKVELNEALEMAVDHLSLYQLTIEDGTAFGDRHDAGSLRGLPADDDAADMYFATQDICESRGFSAYEVSNHAQPGEESRHNLIYWNCGDYVGVGPGAHGRITKNGQRYETGTTMSPTAWLLDVEKNGSGENLREPVSPKSQLTEFVLMGLRLNAGVSLERLRSLGGSIYNNNMKYLCDAGHLEIDGDKIRVAPLSRPILNAVLREILRD